MIVTVANSEHFHTINWNQFVIERQVLLGHRHNFHLTHHLVFHILCVLILILYWSYCGILPLQCRLIAISWTMEQHLKNQLP